MPRVLLVDDIRDWAMIPVPIQFAYCDRRICRTYDEGLKALMEESPWDVLYIDHDLADSNTPERTGYTLLCFLEENLQYLPKKIEIVSANPVGRLRMKNLIERLYKRSDE